MYFQRETLALLSIHADDLMITGPPGKLAVYKDHISKRVRMRWEAQLLEGEYTKYLGKQWRRCGDTVVVRIPPRYLEALVEDMGLLHCRGVGSPAVPGTTQQEGVDLSPEQAAKFRSVVGRLFWIIPERPDLAYAVKEMARQVSQPKVHHRIQLKRILRYLKQTLNLELWLSVGEKPDAFDVVSTVDANVASGENRRSTSGGLLRVGGWLVETWSRTQPVVALSSCEAELLALNVGAAEGKFIQSLMAEIGLVTSLTVESDAGACLAVVRRLGAGRMRHIDVRQLWLQSEVQAKRVMVRKISTEQNPADVLTKAVTPQKLQQMLPRIGLIEAAGDVESLVAVIFPLIFPPTAGSGEVPGPRCCGAAMVLRLLVEGWYAWACRG